MYGSPLIEQERTIHLSLSPAHGIQTKMNESQIRNYFAPNWVFWLFKTIHFLVAVIGIPLLIFVAGAVVATILGALEPFRCNLLAYPFGALMALAAYGWFAISFPRLIATVYAAFETTPEEFGSIIKKWADRLANRQLLFVSASLVVGFLNYLNLNQLWQAKIWLGDVWASSSQWGTFFKWYYGIVDVVIGGFLLGSGAIGVLGSVLIVRDLMKLPLKLSHYRNLQAVGDLSIGLTVWTLVGLALIGPARAVSAPNVLCQSNVTITIASDKILSNLIVSVFSSIAVISVFGLPAFFAHQAIVRAKTRQIASLLDTQHGIYVAVDQVTQRLTTIITPQPGTKDEAYDQNLDELHKAYERIADINKMITEIEAIPDWPITWRGAVQIAGAASAPLFTNLLTKVSPDLAKILGLKP
jgi:hypothetical protein